MHSFELGVGGSLNLSSTGVPIGFSAGYLLDQEMNGDKDTASLFEIGLLYAPNDHFAFGVSVLGSIIDLNGNAELQTWNGSLGLVYYE